MARDGSVGEAAPRLDGEPHGDVGRRHEDDAAHDAAGALPLPPERDVQSADAVLDGLDAKAEGPRERVLV